HPSPPILRAVSLDELPEGARIALFQNISQATREQAERVRKFGHVRPPVVADHQGYKFVAVNNSLHYAKNWRTFHDFLTNYIATVLTREWGNAEIAKPFEERHPIMQWYHLLCDFQKQHVTVKGQIHV